MITEDQLQTLLAEAALAFEPPADGPRSVMSAAGEPRPALPRRRQGHARPRLILAAAAVVLLVAAGLAITGRDATPKRVTSAAAPEARDAGAAQNQALTGTAAAGQANAAGAGASVGALSAPAAVAGTAPASLTKIVKTGSLEVEVAKGRVGDAIGRVGTIAAAVGGFVADSKTDESDGHPSGTITVRVPGDRFEAVTAQLRRLGRVKQAQSAGSDVTAEFTDNAARLHTLATTRESLLQVLAKARSIGDILAVQDRLNAVQTQIEQLQGRQRVLDDQVALGTIAVIVHEPGDAATSPSPGRSAWGRAVHGFASTWAAILGNSGTALAVVLGLSALGALLYGAAVWGRRAYRRQRG